METTQHGLTETTPRAITPVWLVAAIVALGLKAPLIVIGLLNPEGIAGVVPPTAVGPGLFLTLAFLGSSIVFLALRSWFGVVSTGAYCLYSAIGGALLLAEYPWWAAAIVATSVGALIFTLLATRSGIFSAPTASTR
ncbi:hypothetical protein [Arthrobacter sp. 260]|uniref:hypothetical protein n=1 Tax=Arthrobacter sp. 260 TaxID=2735314 RepID=UPI00149184E8|nr:hypothetical protein [Arthrobacter sp. 260]NOJ58891.1 hypothetical protein [Arthrobacter sp. 260]